ncbi:MAG TPA: TRAP transporter small permease [Burkholderiales bacterium]|nr:TRAP transporter small permease [Burkholderiales bacterium]
MEVVEKAYALWRTFQDRVLAYAGAILFVGSTLLALLEVGRRYVLGMSFEWQQDAVTFFILSGVFLYFSISQRRDAHLTVTLIPELFNVFGGRWRPAAELVKLAALVFSCAFMAAVVWWGIPEVEDSIKYESRTESLAFPMWPFLAVLLVSFACMAITMLFQIYRAVQALRGRAVLHEAREEADGTH